MNLHIGILVPRSTSYPMVSQFLVRGIKLAFAKNNITTTFTIEDIGKGGKDDEIMGKANALLINDVELCFAMVGHDVAPQLSQVFSQSGTPLFLLDAGARINLAEAYKPTETTFIHSLAMWQSMYALGEYTAKKYKTIVSTSSLFESGFQFLAAMAKGLEDNGGKIVGYHSTQQFLEDDFKVKLKNTISETQPKALLCLYSGNDADEFYSKSIVKGYDGGLPILTTPLGMGTGEIEIDNITLASTWFAELENEENKTFVEAYSAKHKKTPEVFSALAYEAANTVATVAAAMQNWDADVVVSALRANSHKGIRGEFSYTDTGETTDFVSYMQLPDKTLVPYNISNNDEVKSWNKEQLASGWINPYPCS